MLDANSSVATDESQSTIAIVASSQESSVATDECSTASMPLCASPDIAKLRPNCIFPFGRILTPDCHFVYITLFRHFVYAILFKSLRLLRLHLMQASALPSLVASITFGYYLDSGSTRAADNSVYAWHIYMFSPCFPLKFVLSHIFPFGRIFTPVCHFVYITLFRHFVYAILFKSLRLLRLHLMQASALPSLAAIITFRFHPDSGSMRAADNRVYAWHIYMPFPCFFVKF